MSLVMGRSWSKSEAEEEFSSSTGLQVTLTDEQWRTAVDYYNNLDYPTWEDVVNAIAEVIGAEFDPNKGWVI